MELICTGVRQTLENIVAVATDEDVDCIGLSVLSGTHLEYMQAILDFLAGREGQDIAVTIGGIISDDDTVQLSAMGAAAVFGPRSSTGASGLWPMTFYVVPTFVVILPDSE